MGNNALKLTISKVITMCIGLVTTMLLSRFRTLEEFGTYSQILLVINLVTTILMMGLPNCINYFLARAENDEERRKFLSIYYSLNILLSIVVGLVLVLMIPTIITYFDNPLIKDFWYILAIFPLIRITSSGIENLLIVYERANWIFIYQIIHTIMLLLALLMVELLSWKFAQYMLLLFFVEATFLMANFFIIIKLAGRIKFDLDKTWVRRLLAFSLPLGFASIVSTINIQIDKLMIGRFLNTEQLAIYSNASIELPITVISTSLIAVLMPQMTRMLKDAELEKALVLWRRTTELSYYFICFFVSGFFIFAPDIISLLYSEKYLSGVGVFRIYNLVLLLRCTYFGIILSSKGKTRFVLYSSICSLFINVILSFLFFRIFGMIGPAIANFIAILTIAFAQLVYTSIEIRAPLKSVFPWMAVMRITVINIAFSIVFYTIKGLLPLDFYVGSIIESIVLGFIWGGIYLGLTGKGQLSLWRKLNENK